MGGGDSTEVEAAKRTDRTEMKIEARRLRCTLLNGSAWSTEKKFLRRYKGKCDIFFGIEHRMSKEEMDSSAEKPRKDGDLQQTRRESQMRMQALKTASALRVESLSLFAATWEQS